MLARRGSRATWYRIDRLDGNHGLRATCRLGKTRRLHGALATHQAKHRCKPRAGSVGDDACGVACTEPPPLVARRPSNRWRPLIISEASPPSVDKRSQRSKSRKPAIRPAPMPMPPEPLPTESGLLAKLKARSPAYPRNLHQSAPKRRRRGHGRRKRERRSRRRSAKARRASSSRYRRGRRSTSMVSTMARRRRSLPSISSRVCIASKSAAGHGRRI